MEDENKVDLASIRDAFKESLAPLEARLSAIESRSAVEVNATEIVVGIDSDEVVELRAKLAEMEKDAASFDEYIQGQSTRSGRSSVPTFRVAQGSPSGVRSVFDDMIKRSESQKQNFAFTNFVKRAVPSITNEDSIKSSASLTDILRDGIAAAVSDGLITPTNNRSSWS